eukprot:16437969-Heterocapsa_arctica.AAC.1
MFWNMLLHTRNKHGHCYMLKYWPNKGLVMIKATKENKRKSEEISPGTYRPEDKPPASWGKPEGKGAGRGHAKGAWNGDYRTKTGKAGFDAWQDWSTDKDIDQKPKQTATYDSQGRLQQTWT